MPELDHVSSAFPVVPSPPDPEDTDSCGGTSTQLAVKDTENAGETASLPSGEEPEPALLLENTTETVLAVFETIACPVQPETVAGEVTKTSLIIVEKSATVAEPISPVSPTKPSRGLSRCSSQDSIAHAARSPARTQSPARCFPKEHADYVKAVTTDDGKIYVCAHCGFQSSSEEDIFSMHMPFHTKRSKHSCPNCSFSSNDAATVVAHMDQHRHRFSFDLYQPKVISKTVEIYRCRHCPFETVIQEDYSDHILQHWDKPQNRFHCSLCSFCGPDQRTVVEHEALHYLQRPRYLDGVVKYVRKYQASQDKTPFLLESDVWKPKNVRKHRSMSEAQKEGLRRMLRDY
ncbi:zinc finger protein 568-like [Paramacrobiotus metropolitanus]|uniref:zinc finger protein 568-like n=1 Tax=Paramacrobiotus metropolitanus TaxID=2943436 RepID=UPI002445DE8A|nr:zinc finger protein 568-like [Paramacrobiotus metropolitanus]